MAEALPPPPPPTDAELDILRILWDRGPSTVREVHSAISDAKPVGYTTILKQMQVMHRKRLLVRSDRFRAHVYEPAHAQSDMQQRLAASMLRQVFGGSAGRLLQ